MESTNATSKGLVLIPSKMRKKYKIRGGTRINLVEEPDGIKLIPITPEIIEKNFGFMGTKGKLLKALMEEKKTEREL